MTTAHSKPLTVYKMDFAQNGNDFIVMMGKLQNGYYVYTLWLQALATDVNFMKIHLTASIRC